MTSTADSYVAQDSPGSNFGTSSDLFVQSKSGNANRRTLVSFSLPYLGPACATTAATSASGTG